MVKRHSVYQLCRTTVVHVHSCYMKRLNNQMNYSYKSLWSLQRGITSLLVLKVRDHRIYGGPNFNPIPAWISNHMPSKLWDGIIHLFPNFNGCTVESYEWRSNHIPHCMMDVITPPCWDDRHSCIYVKNLSVWYKTKVGNKILVTRRPSH